MQPCYSHWLVMVSAWVHGQRSRGHQMQVVRLTSQYDIRYWEVSLTTCIWCPLLLCPCTQAEDHWQVSGSSRVASILAPFFPLAFWPTRGLDMWWVLRCIPICRCGLPHEVVNIFWLWFSSKFILESPLWWAGHESDFYLWGIKTGKVVFPTWMRSKCIFIIWVGMLPTHSTWLILDAYFCVCWLTLSGHFLEFGVLGPFLCVVLHGLTLSSWCCWLICYWCSWWHPVLAGLVIDVSFVILRGFWGLSCIFLH